MVARLRLNRNSEEESAPAPRSGFRDLDQLDVIGWG
jgi:hypothetical protein